MVGHVRCSLTSLKDCGERPGYQLWLRYFVAVVMMSGKHCGICGEDVEAIGMVVVTLLKRLCEEPFVMKRSRVGYCGDF